MKPNFWTATTAIFLTTSIVCLWLADSCNDISREAVDAAKLLKQRAETKWVWHDGYKCEICAKVWGGRGWKMRDDVVGYEIAKRKGYYGLLICFDCHAAYDAILQMLRLPDAVGAPKSPEGQQGRRGRTLNLKEKVVSEPTRLCNLDQIDPSLGDYVVLYDTGEGLAVASQHASLVEAVTDLPSCCGAAHYAILRILRASITEVNP